MLPRNENYAIGYDPVTRILIKIDMGNKLQHSRKKAIISGDLINLDSYLAR